MRIVSSSSSACAATGAPWNGTCGRSRGRPLESPAVLVLAEVCGALGFSEAERERVLGSEGVRALTQILESHPIARLFIEPISERQLEALRYVERYARIDHRTYRALCPIWSDETLRLDLADLVARGLLEKNGRKKGTYYTAVSS